MACEEKRNIRERCLEIARRLIIGLRYLKFKLLPMKPCNILAPCNQTIQRTDQFLESIRPEDINWMNDIFRVQVLKIISDANPSNTIDFSDPEHYKQLGSGWATTNCNQPPNERWTQGIAYAYLKVPNLKSRLIIQLYTIPPNRVTIFVNEHEICHFNLVKKACLLKKITLEDEILSAPVSEIAIETDFLWCPHLLLGNGDFRTLGVGIKRLELVYP